MDFTALIFRQRRNSRQSTGRSLIEGFKKNEDYFIFMGNKWCTCAQMFGGLYAENISFTISKDPISPNSIITYRSITYLPIAAVSK
jgi:hypothetical protein